MIGLLTKEFHISKWSLLSVALISFILFIVIFLNDIFPLSVDIYYHLLTALGFSKAGGVSFIDFWNYAPVGRPNLYPPFFSLVASFFIKAGLNPIVLARGLCVLVYSLFLITLWVVIRDRLGEDVAFFTILSSILPHTFFLSIVNQLPAALSLILFLLIFYFFENKKFVTTVLILGFSFYVHLTMPWLTILTLFFYGLFNRERIKSALLTVFFGICLGLPWIINLLLNARYFDLSRIAESRIFEFYPLVFLLGISGIFIAWKEKDIKKYAFIFGSAVAISIVIFRYPYRVFGGEGLLSLVILSGISLNYLYQKIARKYDYGIFIPITIVAVLIVFSPVFLTWTGAAPPAEYKRVQFGLHGSVLMRMASHYQRYMIDSPLINPMETSLSFEEVWQRSALTIESESKEDELIYSNIPYLAGLLAVMSHRFISTGMLYEVIPYAERNHILDAKLIIWLKGLRDEKIAIHDLEKIYKFQRVYEDGLLYIYKNDNPKARVKIRKADVSYKQAALLFLLFPLAIFIDNLYGTRK